MGGALTQDGAHCVFGLHDVVYRPAEGLRAFPDGGIAKYVVDRHKLAMVELSSGEVRVLVDRPNRDWQRGSGGYRVESVRAGSALVSQGGTRPDHEMLQLHWRLDIEDGSMEALDLRQAFAAEGREFERVELVDDDFTLIAVVRNDADRQEIWSRRSDGTLLRLAETELYYGAAEGDIWWYDTERRAGARTDYRSGETRFERRANFAVPRDPPSRVCRPSFGGRDLLYQERQGEAWVERRLPVDPARLR